MISTRLGRSFLFSWAPLAVATLFAAVVPTDVFAANVYPTNLGQSTNLVLPSGSVNLSYLLNDNATTVTVDVLNSSNTVVRTINSPGLTKGSHSVVWDVKDNANNPVPGGNYSFRVNTTAAASGAWTQYSTDTVLNAFELPRGVAVNKNPDSPFYGRLYVSSGRNLPTGAPHNRPMSDAIYMLNADLSDTGIPGGTGPHTGGVTWDAANIYSPLRLEVGPDDSLYITDLSDGHSGLWQADPNLTSAFEVLDSAGRNAAGLNVTHGSISDVIVTGTGANRKIYTVDEDFARGGTSSGNGGVILQYDIGTTATFTGAPTGYAFDNKDDRIINILTNSAAMDSNGNFWLTQNRSGNATDFLSSLVQVDPSGNLIWESVGPHANALATNSLDDPLRGLGTNGSIAYDPVNNLIAVASNRSPGVITLFDPDTKSILGTFDFGSTNNTDVAFDNAGNLYAGNRSAERVRLWSPPNGSVGGRDYVANAFSTSSLGALGAITVIPEPATAGLLALGALALGAFRRRNK